MGLKGSIFAFRDKKMHFATLSLQYGSRGIYTDISEGGKSNVHVGNGKCRGFLNG